MARSVFVGRIQWPPPQEEVAKPPPKVGKLLIEEQQQQPDDASMTKPKNTGDIQRKIKEMIQRAREEAEEERRSEIVEKQKQASVRRLTKPVRFCTVRDNPLA